MVVVCVCAGANEKQCCAGWDAKQPGAIFIGGNGAHNVIDTVILSR